MRPARSALLAALAALLATAGDLLMLYVANARRPELGLPPAPSGALALGGALGVLAIPLYAHGYRAAARLVPPQWPRSASSVAILGGVTAVLGAAIHGLTALAIHADGIPGAPAGDPFATLLASPLLLALWIAVALCALAASLVFAVRTARSPARATRRAGLANPALLTVALIGIGLTPPLARGFLAPAAPNLAHVAFFALCAWALGRQPASEPLSSARSGGKDV